MSSFLDSYFEKIEIEGPLSDEAFAREATCFGLLCKKFPNIDVIAITRALKEIPGEPWWDEELRVVITRADVHAIHEYNKELEGMPTQDLFTFYRQESADAGIEIDELTLPPMDEQIGWFYDQPDAQADFEHWSRAEYWTSDEAVAISFGKNPKVVNGETLKNHRGKAQFADDYFARCDLLDRAIEKDRLPIKIPPADFFAWAHQLAIPIPPALIDAVETKKTGFPEMENLAWDEVKLTLLGAGHVEVSMRGLTKKLALATLGLVDRRKNEPNSCYAMLIMLVENSRRPTKSNSKLQNAIYRLNKTLRVYFGIKVSPIRYASDRYIAAFQLVDKRKAADERAKEKGMRQTVPLDEDNMGHGYTYDDQGLPDDDPGTEYLKKHDR